MAVTRPLKEGSTTTYQAKVAAGFPDILASEVDADLDTIYAAWNGGVATANIMDGSVTTPKLATAPNGVGTTNLNNLAVTLAKLAVGAVIRQAPVTAVTTSANITTTGAWVDVKTASITTSGGLVVVVAVPGWWSVGNVGSVNTVQTGLARDQVIPNIVAAEYRYQIGGAGVWVVPLPSLIGLDAAPAGAHTYHLVCYNGTAGVSVVTGATNPGNIWLLELA